jgi:phage gp46-like protein
MSGAWIEEDVGRLLAVWLAHGVWQTSAFALAAGTALWLLRRESHLISESRQLHAASALLNYAPPARARVAGAVTAADAISTPLVVQPGFHSSPTLAS